MKRNKRDYDVRMLLSMIKFQATWLKILEDITDFGGLDRKPCIRLFSEPDTSKLQHFFFYIQLFWLKTKLDILLLKLRLTVIYKAMMIERNLIGVVFMHPRETQVTMVKWTNAGGQTKRANERSFVYRPPAWRRWRNVKTPGARMLSVLRQTNICSLPHTFSH